MPRRIQRKRTKGWKMPEGVVYVGRPTMYGNPFDWRHYGRQQAISQYRIHLARWKLKDPVSYQKMLDSLRGKDLACWCPLQDRSGHSVPCHADVLLELANQGERRE